MKKNSLLSPPNAYVYDGRSIFYSSAELQKVLLFKILSFILFIQSDAVSISYSEVSKLIQQTFDRKTKFNVCLALIFFIFLTNLGYPQAMSDR